MTDIIAPKKSYHIVTAERPDIASSTHFVTYNLVDETPDQLVDESGNLLVADTLEALNGYSIIAPKRNYHIVVKER